MNTNWRLGAELKALRGEMTQAELARRIGLDRERIGQIERGRVPWPEPAIFNDIARELNVPVTRLLAAAGANIPKAREEEMDWLVSQLSDEGVRLLGVLGRALLSEYRRRPEKEESAP